MFDVPVALIVIVVMAWAIDYINGFHDTANSIATVVSTGVLPGKYAVAMAAVLNFAGAMVGTKVAATIAKGLADTSVIVPSVIIAAVAAAIIWDLLTWWFAIPSSTSHTLMGGIAGAVVAHAGFKALHWDKLKQIFLFIFVSPALGFLVAMLIIVVMLWVFRRTATHRVNVGFRKLQLVSAAAMSFSHGQNDAQKAMGVICMGLILYGYMHVDPHSSKVVIPLWVKIGSATFMGLGTAAGGWKIIKTLGSKIVKLRPIHGFAAESAAAGVLTLAAALGIPVSTTHSITGAIMGVGATMNANAVRWGLAGNIFVAWILTIPVSAGIAALVYKLIHPFM